MPAWRWASWRWASSRARRWTTCAGRRRAPPSEDNPPDQGLLHFITWAQLAQYLVFNGLFDEARHALDQARALLRPGWVALTQFYLVQAEATLAIYTDQAEAALLAWQRTAELAEQVDAPRATMMARVNVAACLLGQRQHASVIAVTAGLLPQLVGPRWTTQRCVALINLLCAHTNTGDLAAAQRAAVEALPLARRGGYLMGLLDAVAILAARDGRYDVAAQLSGYLQAAESAGTATPPAEAAAARDDARQRLAQALSAEQLARWQAHGAALGDAAIDALVLTPPARRGGS